MTGRSKDSRTKTELWTEIERLQFRLAEAEETLEAIRHAEVDALVVAGPQGEQVFSITGAEHIYRVIVETMNEVALTVDPDGTILFCNQRFCDLLKTPLQGAMGRKVTAFAAWPQQGPLKTFLAEAQAGPVQRRLTLRATDGSTVPVQLAASPLHAGDSTSICLVASDLTELEESAHSIRVLRAQEQALEESEARFRTMFESSQDAIVITDDEGVYVQANPAAEAVFGQPPEELVGRRSFDFVREDVDFAALWRTFLATGSFRGELPLVRADGQVRLVDSYAVANILPGRHMVVIRDITERKQTQRALEQTNERLQIQAEELEQQTEELRVQTEELQVQTDEVEAANAALRQSEERLRLAQQAGRVGVFDRDLQDNTAVWTPELEDLFGLPAGTFEGKPEDWAKRVHPEDLPRMTSFLQEWMQSERAEETWEYRLIRPDGQVRWMEGRGRIFRDPGGKPLRIIGTNMDITERKQAEEKLRESKERYRRFFEEDLTGDFVAAPDGKVLECNPAFAEIYGFADLEHARGCDLSQVNPTDWAELMTRLRAECKVQGHQAVQRRPDGREIHVVANVVGQFNEAAELVGIRGYVYDDTERERAEEALRSAALFPEQNPAPVLRVARAGTLLYANGASAFLLRSWDCRPGQAVPEEIRRHVAQALDSQETGEADVVCGSIVYSFSIAPVVSEGYANLYARDVTKRKQAEEALRKSEEKFAKAFRSSPIAVAVTRASDGRIVEVNEAMLRLLRFRRDEVMGRTTLDLGIWADVHDRAQFVQKMSAAGSVRDLEYRLYTKDRTLVTIRLSAELLEFSGETCLLSTLVDVTEQKEAEEALRESEERLKRTQEIAHLGSWELDLANDHLSWSDEVHRIFGLSPQEFQATYEAFLETVHPDDRAAVDAAYSGSLREGRPTYEIEHRIVRKSTGEIRTVHEKCEHVRDASGRIIRSVGMVHDISERKLAEEALRESEDRYHRLFEEDLTGDFISTAEGQILLCNPSFATIFGFPSAPEAVGTNVRDLYLDPQEHESLLARLRREKRIERLEIWRARRDGKRIYIVENLVGHFNERGELYEVKGYVFDDTERKRAEEALRELNTTLESKVAQRTAELQHRARQLQKLTLELSETEDRERRQLAEILHDDLQQQLAATKFHLSLLNSRAKHDPSQLAVVTQVDQMLMEAIQKSRNLSHELSPAVLYHADFIGALNWLAGQVHAKHGLEVAVDAFGEVSVQSEALKTFLYKSAQELLFNVVKHARVSRARIRVRRLGRCICLSVSDRGRGFDPQELRQTPGFGLLSIRERIELLGGRMKIHSVKGQGSTFHIVVPDAEEVIRSRTSVVGEEKGPADRRLPATDYRQPLRVLLADDHAIVREGLRSLLSDEHDVQVVGEAANGREAVDQAYRLQPDVVIMDVAMPLINGDDATRQIKTHLPKTRVIALSMYEEPDMLEKMRHAGAEGYILKTAPSEELLAAIRGKAHASATT